MTDANGKEITGSPFTSDKNGEIHVGNILPGVYKIEELLPEDSLYYCKSENPLTVTVKQGETSEVTFTNALRPGKITIEKVDLKGEHLSGAKFLLEWSEDGSLWWPIEYSDSMDVIKGFCSNPDVVDGTLTTTESGIIEWGNLHPGLYYRIVELEAPEGYVLLTEPAFEDKLPVDDVDVVLGMHIYPAEGDYPALAGTQTGLYATRKWDVTLTGKTAHAGGAPQEGNNAILAAVSAISAMNGFLQDGRGVSRLNVGTIEGGPGRNAIPGYCRFQAETRGSETAVEERIYEKAAGCVKAAAEMFGCEYEINICGMSPAGGGDSGKAAELAALAAELVPELKFPEGKHSIKSTLGSIYNNPDAWKMLQDLMKLPISPEHGMWGMVQNFTIEGMLEMSGDSIPEAAIAMINSKLNEFDVM